MKLAILLLATLAAASPPPGRKLVVSDIHYPDIYHMYNSSHDIVDIAVPLVNPNAKIDKQFPFDRLFVMLFVKADIKDNGDKDFKGLYVLKDRQTKKLLENGQSVAYDNNFNAYLGAKDGLYKYNEKDVTAEKFGNVTESVIKITVDINSGFVYYLIEDYVLYKLDKDEVRSTKIEAVKDARDIIFDFNGTMFFYDGSKEVYAYDGENVLKIEGLPSDRKRVDFIRIPFYIQEVFTIVDGSLFKVNKNGTSEMSVVEFEAQPTAYALDCIMFQYYAYNKKIYKFSFSLFDLLAFASKQGQRRLS